MPELSKSERRQRKGIEWKWTLFCVLEQKIKENLTPTLHENAWLTTTGKAPCDADEQSSDIMKIRVFSN